MRLLEGLILYTGSTKVHNQKDDHSLALSLSLSLSLYYIYICIYMYIYICISINK